jgi:quinol-cytochrome oxidoreductase complex cytochrome b subunit
MSEQSPDNRNEEKNGAIPFFPDYLLDEVIAWFVGLALLVVLASLFPAGLEDKADPLTTPAHVKPEWYFLFFYQFLKLVPRIAGILVAGVAIVVLFLIPFLDRSPSRKPRARRIFLIAGLVVLAGMVFMGIWGLLS